MREAAESNITVLTIADDLTGALEAGALLQAPVAIRSLPQAVPGRIIVDTETRHLSAQAAADAIRFIVANRAPSILYKKTDSTLRGHIGAELSALARAYPDRPIHYIPAYPRMGRTVVGGHLFVHGVPVHETAFGRDARNPVTTSRIADLVLHLDNLRIHDASTHAEVAEAVHISLQENSHTILCGPASVASEIAHHLTIPSLAPPVIEQHARVLVVNGSRHPTAKQQVDRLLPHPNWSVLPIACSGCDADHCVRKIAAAACQQLEAGSFDTLLIIGGDTAMGIVDAQGSKMLYPLGEIAPGMPVSVLGAPGRLKLITKAGGFGPLDLLRNLQ